MADYLVTDTELKSIADAIRTKGETSASLSFPTEFVSAINAISGGLEYEEGTWTPSADIGDPTINFAKEHTDAPVIVVLADATNTTSTKTYTNHSFVWVDYNALFGAILKERSDSSYFRTGCVFMNARENATNQFTVKSQFNWHSKFTSTSFSPWIFSNLYYRAGRTYKWIAIWK